MTDEEQRKLKFNTTVNLAHILTTIGMVAALFTFASDMKISVSTNATEISHLKNERVREAQELKESILQLNSKVDRLIERSNGGGYNYYDNKKSGG